MKVGAKELYLAILLLLLLLVKFLFYPKWVEFKKYETKIRDYQKQMEEIKEFSKRMGEFSKILRTNDKKILKVSKWKEKLAVFDEMAGVLFVKNDIEKKLGKVGVKVGNWIVSKDKKLIGWAYEVDLKNIDFLNFFKILLKAKEYSNITLWQYKLTEEIDGKGQGVIEGVWWFRWNGGAE